MQIQLLYYENVGKNYFSHQKKDYVKEISHLLSPWRRSDQSEGWRKSDMGELRKKGGEGALIKRGEGSVVAKGRLARR